MLTELNVKNFAIIDALNTSFKDGLNIISGETGAGKSIIIGAIGLLLGDRATADMIRSSEEAAEIEAQFDIKNNATIQKKLRDLDLYEGSDLIVKRIVSRSGRNRIYVNGRLSTLSILSSISESLVNICGQHEHQLIMNEDNHINILDEFGNLLTLRQEYRAKYDEYQNLKGKLAELKGANRKKIEREEFVKFQLQELNDAQLTTGEDAALADEKKVLANIQKLKDYSENAYDILYGRNVSLLYELKVALSAIKDIKQIDDSLKLDEQTMDSLYYQLEDTAFIIRNYTKNLSFDSNRLEMIDERLEIIRKFKRKYGSTIEDILKAKETLEEELNSIAKMDEDIESIEKEIVAIESFLLEKADILSRKRLESATYLKKNVEDEIHTLNMTQTQFEVVFRDRQAENHKVLLGPNGYDDIVFYLSTNVGEALKPLNRIASGGELSRIMLAMKKVLASTGSVGTIVFDEVDAGIGGATAEIVGKKLKDVAENHQVLCITHLPQIACFGDRHYRVWKEINRNRTTTCLTVLSDDERLDEITRMLGGVEQTKKTKDHAREMLLSSRR